MIEQDLIRAIGISHLLQPPLTLFLASDRGLGLRAALTSRTALGSQVLHNMAFASVCLPTALGLVLALYPAEVTRAGAARALALLVASFWSWRLYRQLFALRPLWPKGSQLGQALNAILIVIFAVQGPGLGLLLLG
jgi:hypothetical protein